MKIKKNKTANDIKNFTFDAIIESIFASKGITPEEFEPNKAWCVSMDGAPGGDYNFDFDKYNEGPIGERIVIKDISQRIFGSPVDPRPLVGVVREKVSAKISSAKSTEIKEEAKPAEIVLPTTAPKKTGFSFMR